MSDLPRVYEFLATAEDASVDDLLLERLEELELPYLSCAVQVVLQRGREASLTRLVSLRHRLPSPCQELMAARLDLFEGALRKAIHAADQASRFNAIDMISSSQAWSLAYVLPLGLRHQSSETRRRAADALLAMVRASAVSTALPPWSTRLRAVMPALHRRLVELRQGRQHLAEALRQAVSSYDTHLRDTVLEGSLLMAEELQDVFLPEVARGHGRFWRAVQDRLAMAPGASAGAFVLLALGSAAVRGAASRMLAQCTDAEFFRALWPQCWLLGDPAIRVGLRTVRRLEWLEQQSAEFLELPPAELRQAVRFLQATSIPEPQRVELYKNLLLAGGPHSQLIALFALIDTQHPSAIEALRAMIHWGEPRLAAVARREIRRRRPCDALHAGDVAPDTAAGAATATSDEAPQSFQEYWERFGRMDGEQRARWGTALFEREPRALEKLTTRLRDPVAPHRLQALQIIRVLQLAPRCLDDVYDAVRDADGAVRSAAVRALEDIPGSTAERLLVQALTDGDARVRANAIEVLGASADPLRVQHLAPMLQDSHHRVRTAAIDALLKLKIPEAAEALLGLLADSSRAHRASGLWLIDKLDLTDAVRRVKHMAQQDPDPRVRRHARRLLRAARRQRQARAPIPEPQARERGRPSPEEAEP